jgi:plastocyanin
MRRTLFTVLAIAVVGAIAVGPAAGAKGTTVLIRHQVVGCHAWSANGGPFKAALTLQLALGATATIVNNDVMAHKLVQTGGAKVAIVKLPSTMMDMSHEFSGPGVMAHMGASVRVTFAKAGVYTFMTRAGEDYMKGMATKGEDNVLALKVVVS